MRTSRSSSGRVKRTPVSQRQPLFVRGKDPAFEYRFVNDNNDRIGQFLEAGWEIVAAKDVKVGDKRVDIATAEGSNAQVSVGKGDKAFLMRIKKEWYQEDQEAKQEHINELEATMQRDARDGTYGNLSNKNALARESKD